MKKKTKTTRGKKLSAGKKIKDVKPLLNPQPLPPAIPDNRITPI